MRSVLAAAGLAFLLAGCEQKTVPTPPVIVQRSVVVSPTAEGPTSQSAATETDLVMDRREVTQPSPGLAAVALEGHELHGSLRTSDLDSFTDLPDGVRSPKNPQLSSDDESVKGIARSSSQGRLSPEGISSALYARYEAGEEEVGIYGLEAESDAAADQRAEAVRAIWAFNVRSDRARVHRKGWVLLVVWHSGVSSECWEAVNAGLADRLVAP